MGTVTRRGLTAASARLTLTAKPLTVPTIICLLSCQQEDGIYSLEKSCTLTTVQAQRTIKVDVVLVGTDSIGPVIRPLAGGVQHRMAKALMQLEDPCESLSAPTNKMDDRHNESGSGMSEHCWRSCQQGKELTWPSPLS